MNVRHVAALLAAAAALPIAGAATAAEPPPQFGRYMPLFPGLYITGGYAQDDRDSVYDQTGEKRDSASPSAGGSTAFPEKTVTTEFLWHFPMFEAAALPFISSRTYFARAALSYTETRTEGRLAVFAADPSDDNATEADKLENNGSGIGDLTLEFGGYLYGSPSPGWRARERTPLAVLTSLAVNLPYGNYNRDAAISSGTNTTWAQARVAAHWQPWLGGFVDAGYAYRAYFQNYDAAFGRTMPTDPGDDQLIDASLAQRVLPGLYAGAFATRRTGAANRYESPRFAVNPPPPTQTTSMSPVPGYYYDDGVSLTTAGLSLSYFVTQRWLAALHYTRPLAGSSGEFDLPYEEHSPAGCKDGATNCSLAPAGSVHVDGLGQARAYASDRLMLTLTHSFGLSDTFTCTGCEP